MAETPRWKLPFVCACLVATALCHGGQAPSSDPAEAEPAPPQKEHIRKIDPRAYAMYAAGVSMYDSEDWTGAEHAFCAVIDLDPGAVEARVQLTRTLYRMGRTDEAAKVIRQAVEADPASVEARRTLGLLLIQQMRTDEGLAQWQAALEYAEGDERLELLERLSRVYLLRGDMESAVKYTEQQLQVDPNSIEALERLVELHKASGDHDAAIERMGKLAQLMPKDFEFQQQLAALQTSAGQLENAAKTYQQCLELARSPREELGVLFSLILLMEKSEDAARASEYRSRAVRMISSAVGKSMTTEYFERLAELIGTQRDVNDAVAAFRKEIQTAKPEALGELHYGLAALLMFSQQDTAGIEEARKAVAADQTRANYYGLLGVMLTRNKEYEEAFSVLKRAASLAPEGDAEAYNMVLIGALVTAGKRPAAMDVLRGIIQANPKQAKARCLLAEMLATQLKYAEAAEQLEAAVPLLHDDEALLLQTCTILSEYYRKLGRTGDALAQLRKVIGIDPKETIAYLQLAWALSDEGRYDQAIELLDEAIEKVPAADRSRCLLALAGVYQQQGNLEKAESITREVIQAEPENPRAYSMLAGMMSRAEKYDEAVDLVEKAIAVSQEYETVRYRLHLANIYQDMGRDDDCEKVLREEYIQAPDSPMVNNHLGYFYAEKGVKLDAAVQLIKTALKDDPGNGAYLDSLGWAYYKQGKYQDALEQLQLAAQDQPDAVIFDHLGDVLQALGRDAEARAQWHRALELDPDDELAGTIREKLQEGGAPEGDGASVPEEKEK